MENKKNENILFKIRYEMKGGAICDKVLELKQNVSKQKDEYFCDCIDMVNNEISKQGKDILKIIIYDNDLPIVTLVRWYYQPQYLVSSLRFTKDGTEEKYYDLAEGKVLDLYKELQFFAKRT